MTTRLGSKSNEWSVAVNRAIPISLSGRFLGSTYRRYQEHIPQVETRPKTDFIGIKMKKPDLNEDILKINAQKIQQKLDTYFKIVLKTANDIKYTPENVKDKYYQLFKSSMIVLFTFVLILLSL
jgi:hypothetical protein